MKKNNRTGSHLFFIEFLIVLFFFLIVSTVCLRMFARAHGITRRADALSHAQAAASSVAAAVEHAITDSPEPESDAQVSCTAILGRAAESLPDAFLTNLPYSAEPQEGLAAAYDRDFQPCGVEGAYYLLTAALTPDGPEDSLDTLYISVHDYNQTLIYELSASFHRPATRKEVLQ